MGTTAWDVSGPTPMEGVKPLLNVSGEVRLPAGKIKRLGLSNLIQSAGYQQTDDARN